MGAPITWQNINSPDLTGASQMMGLAQRSFNGGFEKLNDVLKERRAIDDANWENQKKLNTEAFLSEIGKYRTAEEFQAAQASGAFDRLRSQYGGQLDQAAVRSAEDGRTSILQGREKQAIEFNNFMTDEKQAPIREAFKAAVLKKDSETANRLIAENPNLRHLSDLIGFQRNTDRQNVEWFHADTDFQRRGEKHKSDLLTAQADRTYKGALANQATAAAERYRAEATAEGKGSGKSHQAAIAAAIANSPLSGGTLDNEEGLANFEKGLKGFGLDSTQVEDIRRVLMNKYANGIPIGVDGEGKAVRIGVPVVTALQAIGAAHEKERFRNFFGSTSQGDRVAEKLDELITSDTFFSGMQRAYQAQNQQLAPLLKPTNPPVPSRSIWRATTEGAPTGNILDNAIKSRLPASYTGWTPEQVAAKWEQIIRDNQRRLQERE